VNQQRAQIRVTALADSQQLFFAAARGAVWQMIQWEEQTQKSRGSTDIFLAHRYAMLDDEAHAMLCLERLYDEREPWLLDVLLDPALDHLRSSPRFRDLVRRIGLPPSPSDTN
jgi:hypothetical protein